MNNYEAQKEVLLNKVEELHDLAVDACELCGGSYEENLGDSESVFVLNGVRFRMTIKKV